MELSSLCSWVKPRPLTGSTAPQAQQPRARPLIATRPPLVLPGLPHFLLDPARPPRSLLASRRRDARPSYLHTAAR